MPLRTQRDIGSYTNAECKNGQGPDGTGMKGFYQDENGSWVPSGMYYVYVFMCIYAPCLKPLVLASDYSWYVYWWC